MIISSSTCCELLVCDRISSFYFSLPFHYVTRMFTLLAASFFMRFEKQVFIIVITFIINPNTYAMYELILIFIPNRNNARIIL